MIQDSKLSCFGARIQVILNGNDLSSYIKNMVRGDTTLGRFEKGRHFFILQFDFI